MIAQRFDVTHELNSLSVNPIAQVLVENADVIVELSDGVTKLRIAFTPYQAVRVTTSDCFALSGEMFISPRTVMEVSGSEWLEQLRASLAQVDSTATFMNQARHFVIPCDDCFIEVVAWDCKLSASTSRKD